MDVNPSGNQSFSASLLDAGRIQSRGRCGLGLHTDRSTYVRGVNVFETRYRARGKLHEGGNSVQKSRSHLKVSSSIARHYNGLACFLAVVIIAFPAYGRDNGDIVRVSIAENSPGRTVIDYVLGDYTAGSVTVNGLPYTHLALGKESSMEEAGAPSLPRVCRSIIIPDDAEMAIRVLASEHHDVTDVLVEPSRGIIYRTTNPATVPYTFGDAYRTDAFYPGELASLREPYIMRDYRGVVVILNPFQYNPMTRTLRVYTDITLEVLPVGPGRVNALDRARAPRELSLAFHQTYQRHFLNYNQPLRYTPLAENGNMLIICHDAWLSNVQPLVDHKNSIGISTTAVGVSTIPGGNTATAIKSYIQGVYNQGNLAFVLLVGDAAQVATPNASGGSSDPTYSKLAGSDNYPDIIVGRFSAEDTLQVDTQVQRTIEYENMPATQQAWFTRGTGIGSDQGPGDDGEYDYQHIDNIRTDLLNYGYTVVDQIYDPGATASQVSAALNAGRGIINYCGHGSTTSWGTTGFSNSNVSALTNDNMLPFIFSVACVNGAFDGATCFAEAWLRATHNSEPTGAIATYMSSINQSWVPPMIAQDESNDLLVAQAYISFGALCFAGSCKMMDEQGAAGVEMFDTWHVFGDPSVRTSSGTVPPTPTSTPTATPTSTLTPTHQPTGIPTSMPTPTPVPPLGIAPSPLTAGERFTLGITLAGDITTSFDFYLLADTPVGIYTIYLNGSVKRGITPIYKNVPTHSGAFSTTVSPAVRIPKSIKGETITFYTVVVEAGKIPPVRSPSDLRPDSAYVIMMDRKTMTVAP